MPRIEVITTIRASIETVFDLSRSIDVHQLSQTAHQEKAVGGRVSGLIELNEEVVWEARHLGVSQRLSSRIVSMARPSHFRDSMVKGAFRRFDHDHFFVESADGVTTVRDVFDYTSPFGLIGRFMDVVFLKSYMQRLLVERNLVIKGIAESKEHEKFSKPA
jgi:ligand-binding SRPBCC domain-containing protein